MLAIFGLQSTLRNSLTCTLTTIPTSPKPLIQKRFFLQFQAPKRFETLRTQMSSNPTQVAADYAKTGRSSCKKCSEPIAKQALRLALITKDARGWDATKWHHFDCFSFGPKSVSSVEEIKGFEDLKSSDQEAVKKLFSEVEESNKEAREVDEDKNEVGEKDLNNAKILAVAADYAKSSRSSCKKCSEPIAKNALRLALITKDVRGWDATKWHHLDCFSFGSGSVASVENIKGFEDLKSSDQEAVKKLFSKVEKSLEEDSNGKQSSQKRKVPEVDEDENEVGEKDSKKAKVSKMDISFSVSDVKDKYKEATLPPKWKAFQTIIFLERDDSLHDSSKIAAFDFDGCLANTSVKRVGADAWSLMYPSIPDKLQSLYKDGYKLVIFTNEANIERWKNKRQAAVDSKIGRLNNFIKEVKVPIQVFIACGNSQGEDPFRKPKQGMWHILEQHFNSGITIDKNQSFYVGDAAGRSNDHSDADIKFAEANGLKFYVPEEFFDV